ncbi:hypothetical protein BUALT_Bualt02G0007200 [Buddleja alternifolia]|uniref:ubiquitinyl hydrolase 1 n=1 Tax=Buddleja alternifolia TaxID=168488 RepID=A0AAV6Y4V6_9LAMI|nr:hypothetical protein BUALT_Bualt02G0007200 [Buddleja alternifolia]
MTVMAPPVPNEQEDEDMLVPRSGVVEGPMPMEVVPDGTDNTAESQPVEDNRTAKYTWRIENFSKSSVKRLYSDIFELGDHKWRILIFPKGNNADFLSMYLDVADSANLPYGWSRYAHFSLTVVNQVHTKYSVRKETQHQFNARENDWGFTSFMSLGELYDPSRGFLVNDTCVIEAEVAVYRAMDHWLYDSKKETGFVGLKNQGATCYMNSLLQTLYHIPYFRKVVYHMPTNVNDMPSASIPLALQSLFYKLQYNDDCVATKELTNSFGWDTYDAFLQHDVQELNRVLCEKLEEKMKRTVVEGAIQQLFEGHHMNYIECINVDYKSSRKESFYDLQLDVKGCHDVYASFDKYVAVEHLDGDNKYQAEQHGLQDAKKGVLFTDFPPVLQLHLKRFEYDFVRDVMVKINDRYEFPFELDLDRDNGKYLSPDADRRVRNLYTLHSVLVHSGGVNGGHYYAFIRPTLSGQWYKFDDERVTKEDMNKALEELYGGEEEHVMQTNPGINNTPFKFTRHSNAYMLVYIRESDKDKIMCKVDEKDIAEHLKERMKREQEEKEQTKKELAEAHVFTSVKVTTDEDFARQIGRDVFFDLVEHDKVRSFRVRKLMPFTAFKEEIAKEFGIPVQFQRFWMWAKRQNHTYRPSRPLSFLEEAQTIFVFETCTVLLMILFCNSVLLLLAPVKQVEHVDMLLLLVLINLICTIELLFWENYLGKLGQPSRLTSPSSASQGGDFLTLIGHLSEASNKVQNAELKLFLEVELGPDLRPLPLPNKGKDDILLFFKLYDPEKEELRYAGRLFVNNMGKPTDILAKLNEIAGYAPDEEIELYEEIKFQPNVMCEHIDKRLTFKSSQLEDGDIVCFQKSSVQTSQRFRCPDAPSFLLYRHNLQVIHFRSLGKPKEDVFCLQLSKLDTYDEVVERVALQLGVDDASKIRLTSHSSYSKQPKPHPIKYRGVDNLLDMLLHYNQISDILYYEVLDMPLPELQGLRTLKVAFRHATKNELENHSIRLPKESTVGDVLEDLRMKVELSHPNAELRLIEVSTHRIYKIFLASDKIETINDSYWSLRAEEFPDEEKNLGPNDCLIHVYHFMNVDTQNQMQIQNFGEPFLLVIHEDETLAHVKVRVQKKLQVPDEEFSKTSGVCASWEEYLGLEHIDNAPKKSLAANQYRPSFEKAVKIYN